MVNKFKLRNDKERIKKIYLNNKYFEKYFYFVDKNMKREKKINRNRNTVEAYNFLTNLNFF